MQDQNSPTIHYRPMVTEDMTGVPLQCQGTTAVLGERIADVGAAAILAFDEEQHIAQLQFRRYDAELRSPDGLWDPLYWGDFGAHAPQLPHATLAVFCFHVGQLEDSEARDPRYQGRGIGLAMLDFLIRWAQARKFTAIVAKFTPARRAVMSFMGGQPEAAYAARGFVTHASWVDKQLRSVIGEKQLLGDEVVVDSAATVGCCVKRLQD
jgi:GNAT superfamily N-acetyltransferase